MGEAGRRLPVRPLIPHGFWLVGAVRLRWEQAEHQQLPFLSLGQASWNRIPPRYPKETETVRDGLAPAGEHLPHPSGSRGTCQSFLLTQEHLEIGGSVHENKMAKLINDPREQWPRVFPWSFSLGTVSCYFLGGPLPGTFRICRTLLSFFLSCFPVFSGSVLLASSSSVIFKP